MTDEEIREEIRRIFFSELQKSMGELMDSLDEIQCAADKAERKAAQRRLLARIIHFGMN